MAKVGNLFRCEGCYRITEQEFAKYAITYTSGIDALGERLIEILHNDIINNI